MAKFEVRLSATLPATASMIVDADTEEEAKEFAEEHYLRADWMGSDVGDVPSGCDVEVYDVSLISE